MYLSKESSVCSLKYNTIYSWVVDNIQDGSFPYNTKLPSEAKLCHQFQVSRQTVRNALKRLADAGYIRSVKGSGSYVSKHTRPHSRKIGVMFTTISGYICADIFNGLESELTAQGYSIQLELSHNCVENETRFLQKMLQSNVSGLILEPSKSSFPSPNAQLYRKLDGMGIPYVFVNGYYSNVPANAVVWDDENIAYKLTRHLIESGHPKIGCFFRFDEMQGGLRYLGYARALQDSGLNLDEQVICWYDINNESNFVTRNASSIEYTLDHIVKNCTAMICYNDIIAGTIINKLRARGVVVPEQMTIVSFDNSDLVQFFGIEGFLSFNHPKHRIGRCAAELLLKQIRGEVTEPQILTVASKEPSMEKG